MSSLGINNNNKPVEKKEPKTFEFKDFTVDNVRADLEFNISQIMNNKRYLTLAKLAASYKLDVKQFRGKCFDNDELANLLGIYNGVYVEDIMNQAINSGKLNAQVEDYLKKEINAYSGSGFEQHITFVEGAEDDYELDVDNEVSSFDLKTPTERVMDLDLEDTDWEVDNEEDTTK